MIKELDAGRLVARVLYNKVSRALFQIDPFFSFLKLQVIVHTMRCQNEWILSFVSGYLVWKVTTFWQSVQCKFYWYVATANMVIVQRILIHQYYALLAVNW